MLLYKTPAGFSDLWLRGDGLYLTGLFFEGSRNLSDLDSHEEARPDFDPTDTLRWLDLYFRGTPPDFIPAFRIENLTPFRREVMELMLKIPYGHTSTYGALAAQIAAARGAKKISAQAVGGAVGQNPICLIVPCHRVVGARGALIGYGGGIENKKALLQHESGLF